LVQLAQGTVMVMSLNSDMSLVETKAMNGPTRFRLNDEEGCALKNLV